MTVPPDVFHRTLAYGERHGVANLNYADAANRIAGTNEGSGTVLSAANVGQYADQLDDNSTWKLVSHSPITWIAVSNGGSLKDAYDFETGTRIIEQDDGSIIWRPGDGYGFRTDTGSGSSGTATTLADGDCEEVDMSSWDIDDGAAKDAIYPRTGSRCILLAGNTVGQTAVCTVGDEVTLAFYARNDVTSTRVYAWDGLTLLGEWLIAADSIYHLCSVSFTVVDGDISIEEGVA